MTKISLMTDKFESGFLKLPSDDRSLNDETRQERSSDLGNDLFLKNIIITEKKKWGFMIKFTAKISRITN